MTKVLIVEDEQDALDVLGWWLQENGHQVLTARTGKAALELGMNFQPDVVITDYFLEDDLNGVDVIERFRREQPCVRAVLVTGLLREGFRDEFPRLDGVPVLTKPFEFRRLQELVDGHA
ncbi:MAG TPA: response regulator [Polyangiaceae bacterium]|nr:response regulator [Polyangiaceae bacterium]